MIVNSVTSKFTCCSFFFSSRRRHTIFDCDWSSDVCSSDLHSVAYLTEQLGQRGYVVSPATVYRLLDDLGYSLKANRKRFTGPPHPDRDRQFEYRSEERRVGKEGRSRWSPDH